MYLTNPSCNAARGLGFVQAPSADGAWRAPLMLIGLGVVAFLAWRNMSAGRGRQRRAAAIRRTLRRR
jgi:hypothetical protein